MDMATKTHYMSADIEAAIQLNYEDFLNIADLSDFSDEDILGPTLPGMGSSLTQERPINDEQTAPATTETGTSSLLLRCQDEPSFDWLTSFPEDETALIYGASSFVVEFLDKSDSCAFGQNEAMEKILEHDGYDGKEKTDNRNQPTPLPAKARVKRARSATKGWAFPQVLRSNSQGDGVQYGESHLKPDVCTLSAIDMSTVCDSAMNPRLSDDLYSYPSQKRCKKLEKHGGNNDVYVDDGDHSAAGRRCTHCLSNKTPQWRAGPLGPKTLCNACGVRYKSGRLFDEYRPAKSPTFLSYKHSNSHKKVVEMRRRKGLDVAPTINQSMQACRRSEGGRMVAAFSSTSIAASSSSSRSPSSSSSSSSSTLRFKTNSNFQLFWKCQANSANLCLQ